jgi:hypothetical protein
VAQSKGKKDLRPCNLKKICQRSDYAKLTEQLTKKVNIQTKAMKRGVELESEAALKYAQSFGRNVFLCGLYINPFLPHQWPVRARNRNKCIWNIY